MTTSERDAINTLIHEAQTIVTRFKVLANSGRRIVRDDINVSSLEHALAAMPPLTESKPTPARRKAGKK